MSSAVLTGAGDTTIPDDIREHLGLKPGDRIRFVIDDDGRVVLVPLAIRLRDLRGCLPAPTFASTDDDMEAAIRDRFRQEDGSA